MTQQLACNEHYPVCVGLLSAFDEVLVGFARGFPQLWVSTDDVQLSGIEKFLELLEFIKILEKRASQLEEDAVGADLSEYQHSRVSQVCLRRCPFLETAQERSLPSGSKRPNTPLPLVRAALKKDQQNRNDM